MSPKTVQEILKTFNDQFHNSGDSYKKTDMKDVPDGEYVGEVIYNKLDTHYKNEELVIFTLGIRCTYPNDDKYNECVFWYKNRIKGNSLYWLKKDLQIMGFQLQNLTDLITLVENDVFKELTLKIKKETSGEYTNIYLLKRVENVTDPESSPEVHPDPF